MQPENKMFGDVITTLIGMGIGWLITTARQPEANHWLASVFRNISPARAFRFIIAATLAKESWDLSTAFPTASVVLAVLAWFAMHWNPHLSKRKNSNPHITP